MSQPLEDSLTVLLTAHGDLLRSRGCAGFGFLFSYTFGTLDSVAWAGLNLCPCCLDLPSTGIVGLNLCVQPVVVISPSLGSESAAAADGPQAHLLSYLALQESVK